MAIRNVASFVAERDVQLSVEGVGDLRVDTAFGGDSFVMVDAADSASTSSPRTGSRWPASARGSPALPTSS